MSFTPCRYDATLEVSVSFNTEHDLTRLISKHNPDAKRRKMYIAYRQTSLVFLNNSIGRPIGLTIMIYFNFFKDCVLLRFNSKVFVVYA